MEDTNAARAGRMSRDEPGLTDHVNGGPSRPGPMSLLDGLVERGLTQLNGSHADPEAQAEQPGHDRTHLFRSSRGDVSIRLLSFLDHLKVTRFCLVFLFLPEIYTPTLKRLIY